jgi:hypothetical protein
MVLLIITVLIVLALIVIALIACNAANKVIYIALACLFFGTALLCADHGNVARVVGDLVVCAAFGYFVYRKV